MTFLHPSAITPICYVLQHCEKNCCLQQLKEVIYNLFQLKLHFYSNFCQLQKMVANDSFSSNAKATINFTMLHLMKKAKVLSNSNVAFYSHPFAINFILNLLGFPSSVSFILYTHYTLIDLFTNGRSMKLHVLFLKI
jgi:hypothetical protein